MNRKDELLKIVGENPTTERLVEQIIFIESQLDSVKALPFIKFNPNNPSQQKSTPAANWFIKLSQQYNLYIKTLGKLTGQDGNSEDSPLRKWVKERADKGAQNMDTG